MDRRTERIGYLTEKENRWILTINELENTFTNEFSALYFATRYNIKVIYDKPRNQSVR